MNWEQNGQVSEWFDPYFPWLISWLLFHKGMQFSSQFALCAVLWVLEYFLSLFSSLFFTCFICKAIQLAVTFCTRWRSMRLVTNALQSIVWLLFFLLFWCSWFIGGGCDGCFDWPSNWEWIIPRRRSWSYFWGCFLDRGCRIISRSLELRWIRDLEYPILGRLKAFIWVFEELKGWNC